MKNRPDILLWLLLLALSLPMAAQQPDEALLSDSTYRHVIRTGSDSLNCYLAYRPGNYEVIRSFENNDAELTYLDAFIHRAFADTLIYVREVRLTGYCSIEGLFLTNERLAINRVNGMKKYLDKEYRLSKRYPVTLGCVAEDWKGLRKLIDVSSYPWREEVLAIIDRVGIFEGRESLLMKLDGGNPYREMMNDLFPKLRRVEITVEYDLKRIIEQRYQRKMDDTEFQAILQEERRKAAAAEARLRELEDSLAVSRQAETEKQARQKELSMAARKRERETERANLLQTRRAFRPLIGIKTNLIDWAGVTPELERTTFMPNLAAEVFFANRWSVEFSATYSDFAFGDREHWGLTGYRLEPRWWLRGEHRYTGLYIGIYGQAGDFNSQRTSGNHTGTYLQGGVSAGWYWLLSKHWGVETGVRGGYQKADVTPYEKLNGRYYKKNDEVDGTRMGLMGVDVSVSYRF